MKKCNQCGAAFASQGFWETRCPACQRNAGLQSELENQTQLQQQSVALANQANQQLGALLASQGELANIAQQQAALAEILFMTEGMVQQLLALYQHDPFVAAVRAYKLQLAVASTNASQFHGIQEKRQWAALLQQLHQLHSSDPTQSEYMHRYLAAEHYSESAAPPHRQLNQAEGQLGQARATLDKQKQYDAVAANAWRRKVGIGLMVVASMAFLSIVVMVMVLDSSAPASGAIILAIVASAPLVAAGIAVIEMGKTAVKKHANDRLKSEETVQQIEQTIAGYWKQINSHDRWVNDANGGGFVSQVHQNHPMLLSSSGA